MATKVTIIKSVPLGRFKNAKHAAFSKLVVRAVELFSIISEMFEHYVNILIVANDKEDVLFQRFERPFYTEQKQKDDAERINVFLQLREVCRAAFRSSNLLVKDSAEKIYKVSDKYGGSKISKYTQGERTGLISNFIDDLNEKLQSEVQLLGISVIVNNLATANNQYIKTEQERIENDAQFLGTTLLEARGETDIAIRTLFSEVNNAARSGFSTQLLPFISYINAAISDYSYGLGNNSSSASKPNGPEDEGGEGSEGEDTEKKHRDLIFIVGEEELERVSCEVGKEIPLDKIPEAPEGTVWGDIPEVMPDEDVYVFAVPEEETGDNEGDENEGDDNNTPGTGDDNTNPGETTEPDHVRAFFIFANGEEETISGLPGSPMQPPINTVGYMWQPAPPRIIPTKDTTYREVVYVDDWK